MKEALRIAICEDTKKDEDLLLQLLEKNCIPTVCTVFHSGEELVEAYCPQDYDLILTDIYMNGITGIDAVTKIREIDEDVPVAFVTTSTDFALESYRLSALKYIEKPYTEKDIDIILRLAQLEKDNVPSLTIHKNRQEEKIPFSQILYLEQHTHLLTIYLKNGSSVEIYEKLSTFIPELTEQGFVSPHKSFSVNLSFVDYIDTEFKCFVMQNGKNIPIRRESMGKAKKALEDFLFSRTRRMSHEK